MKYLTYDEDKTVVFIFVFLHTVTYLPVLLNVGKHFEIKEILIIFENPIKRMELIGYKPIDYFIMPNIIF